MTKLIRSASLLLLFSCTLALAQKQELDTLIQKIDNKDAYIVLVKTMSPRIHGAAANRIIQIGKKATPELITVLNTTNKGIIAHFILSEIWKEKWTEDSCCPIKTIGNEEIIVINGLEIHISGTLFYATNESLKKTVHYWQKIWQS